MITPSPSRSLRAPNSLIFVLASLWLALLSPSFGAQPATRTFDLPAGDAEKMPRDFSVQSGIEVLFSSEAASGVRTKAVKGDFVPAEAIKLLLEGTNLVARLNEKTGALLVSRTPSGAPTPPGKNDPRTVPATYGDRPRQNQSQATTVDDVRSRDEIVALTPFEVRTDRDAGYTATSALAGGRTDTPLKETPAAISVFTRQFLDDIAATSFHDAAEWAVNSIPEYRRNESPYGDYAVNLRSLGASFPSRNYFLWYIDGDGYNTERLEFARGPNGVLFGDGNIGGITTTWTKRARLDRPFRSLSARVDTYGGYRGTLDINQPASGTFGLRFNAVYDRALSWRDNSDNIRDGQHLAGVWKIDNQTNLTVEAEIGHRDTNVYTNNYGDAASYWDGKTVYDGKTAPVGGGLGRLGTYYLNIPAVPQAGYANWANFYVTNGTGIALQPRARGDVAGFSALPRKEFNLQPVDSVVGLDYYTYSVFLDRRFSDGLYAQVAYNRARNIRESHLNETLFTDYRIDVNQVLPNGQPNPKFGVPFADAQRNTQNQSNLVDDLRGLVTYSFDTTWLKQRVSLIGGERRDLFDYWQKRLFRTNGPNPNFGASDNQYRERLYWDQPGAFPLDSIPVLPGYTFDYKPTFVLHQRKFLDYAQLASTSKFFDDRLTVLLGLRYDHFYQTQKSTSGIPADPVTGLPQLGGVNYQPGKLPVAVLGGKTVTDVSPVSKNVGAV
jgi:outer membrane receptor protein involved in Fe transport